MSPHCDDAVFASGDLIAAHPGTVVVTVFAAAPADDRLRPWDAECGFVAGQHVMDVRRAEDAEALAVLGARPRWLAFRDDQYGHNADAPVIAEALLRELDATKAETVGLPLGLFHRDHELAHEAALLARAARPDLSWIAYEDAIYRRFPGEPAAARVAGLRARGLGVDVFHRGGPASLRKRRAVACYRSQLRGLAASGRAGHADAFEAECCWLLRDL